MQTFLTKYLCAFKNAIMCGDQSVVRSNDGCKVGVDSKRHSANARPLLFNWIVEFSSLYWWMHLYTWKDRMWHDNLSRILCVSGLEVLVFALTTCIFFPHPPFPLSSFLEMSWKALWFLLFSYSKRENPARTYKLLGVLRVKTVRFYSHVQQIFSCILLWCSILANMEAILLFLSLSKVWSPF